MSRANFNLSIRNSFRTTFFSVEVSRWMEGIQITRKTPEKAIPLVVEYDINGDIQILQMEDHLDAYKPSPYYAGSPDFTQERLDNVEVDNLYTHFGAFPNVSYEIVDGNRQLHPFSEAYYSSIVIFRADPEIAKELKSVSYTDKETANGVLFGRAVTKFQEQTGLKLDPFSVPKREVGSVVHLAGKDGVSVMGKVLSFGLHDSFPLDRLTREASSLHSCERFINPKPVPLLMKSLSPYFTMAKVLVVHTKEDFLDSGYVTKVGQKNLAVKLERLKYETNLEKIPQDQWCIDFVANKASIEAVHVNHEIYDESVDPMGTIRVVLPGGVKLAAAPDPRDEYDCSESDIDLVLDFRTLARKGSAGLFWWDDPEKVGTTPTKEEVHQYAREALGEPERIFYNGEWYSGHVLYIPIARPGQRYTDLCKPCKVTFDPISHAILNQEIRVPKHLSTEYKELREFAGVIQNMIEELECE